MLSSWATRRGLGNPVGEGGILTSSWYADVRMGHDFSGTSSLLVGGGTEVAEETFGRFVELLGGGKAPAMTSADTLCSAVWAAAALGCSPPRGGALEAALAARAEAMMPGDVGQAVVGYAGFMAARD